MVNEIDLHGFRIHEIKGYLDSFLDQVPSIIKEVHVIHGYQNGSAIQSYVRNTYHHRRINRIMLSMNSGETIFVLN
ncbi:MAG: hypothetical protein RR945_07180 [Erysipelotrichaceae bacterium]